MPVSDSLCYLKVSPDKAEAWDVHQHYRGTHKIADQGVAMSLHTISLSQIILSASLKRLKVRKSYQSGQNCSLKLSDGALEGFLHM